MTEADEYEYSEPVTVYGSATAIQLPSPFGPRGGACEYAIIALNPEGAGTLVITPNGNIGTVGATNDGGFPGFMFKFVAGIIPYVAPIFTPLKNAILYITPAMGAANVSVTFVFRRRRETHIPQFSPMHHSANPENEFAVNAARAEAITRASQPSTPRTR